MFIISESYDFFVIVVAAVVNVATFIIFAQWIENHSAHTDAHSTLQHMHTHTPPKSFQFIWHQFLLTTDFNLRRNFRINLPFVKFDDNKEAKREGERQRESEKHNEEW